MKIVTETRKPPPKTLGITHWSPRLLGRHLRPARHHHLVHGPGDVTGKVTATAKPRHPNTEFVASLKQIERAYRDVVDDHGRPVELHLVMATYAAHKHANAKDWLAENPRFTVHFTPTHASWMNLVEVWFSLIERPAIRRGVFTSIRDLNAKIRAFINGWDTRSHPFVWTRTAEQMVAEANRQKTSNADHWGRPMHLQLTGRTALATGSTQGIGLAIAAGLTEAGARVVVNGRTAARVEAAAADLTGDVVGVATDVTTAEGVAALVEQVPDVDILVDNLGIFGATPALEITDEEWRRYFEVNVLSAARLFRTYLPGRAIRSSHVSPGVTAPCARASGCPMASAAGRR